MSIINHVFMFNVINDVPEIYSYALAVFSSTIAGLFLGWDREVAGKSAGVRTFALVCLGSTLFTMIAREIGGQDSTARIVAQIVSGIGFIGAGAVFRSESRVSGLTTAAGIWVAAALGVVFGLGFLPFGFAITAFVFALFRLQHIVERWAHGPCRLEALTIHFEERSGKSLLILREFFEAHQNVKLISETNEKLKANQLEVQYCARHKHHGNSLSTLASFDFVTKLEKS